MGKSKFIKFNISLSEDTFNALEEFCSDYSLSRSSAINFAVKKMLKERDMELMLHEDIDKLFNCFEDFCNRCGDKLELEEIRECDDVLKLCNAAKKCYRPSPYKPY